MTTLIHNATIVNEGRCFRGAVLIEDGRISEVFEGEGQPVTSRLSPLNSIDASGALLLPGIIDTHVHFREPGMTHKADICHESRAALAGGVTSVMDMPNVNPPTTTVERWKERMEMGLRNSRVNYSCYIGATNEGIADVPAPIKLFMGSSTGNMLVDKREALKTIFQFAADHNRPIVAHCEDTQRINERMAEAKQLWGDNPSVEHHPWIRDEEACYRSSALAAELAQETGARLHIAHITTARELELLNGKNITGEVCLPHLLFCDQDYARLGTRIKCNPAIKTESDREALRQALKDGRLLTIGTDHAPHLLSEKQGGCARAASGMPMVQFSLVSMLGLVDEGVLTLERMVDAMCHQPALLFGIKERGFLRPGYKADFVLVRPETWTLHEEDILSKCGWSPLEGYTFNWRVQQTFVNGHLSYDHGNINDATRGEAVTFT
ncbi:MAG: dihydroorotase [Bacteroidaceae bacterium]|nr:dihydroorotase [Bacteroidaceae bacterium]